MLIDGSHFEISNVHAQFNDIHYKIMIFISLPFALDPQVFFAVLLYINDAL